MQSLLQDLRYGSRQLTKSPGFTLTAIISLALGIGATTAVFSVVYAVLLDPYPYAGADRMVHFVASTKKNPNWWLEFTGPQYQKLRESPLVESMAAFQGESVATTGGELPEDLHATLFTGNAFNFFGVPALLGRGLQPIDAPEGADPEPVAVLGYKFWQRHYNGEHDVVGKTIQLAHKTYTIVGVAQPRFTWNDGDVYLPLKLSADPSKTLFVITKLKPGVTHAAIDAQLQPLFAEFAKETPTQYPSEGFRMTARGLNEHFVSQLGPTLYLLLGSVALLLLIGCGNVSILLLARGTAREHEFAVRAAVGAGRTRLVRQLLTESLVLSLAGAALGVLLAYRTVASIASMLPEFSFPHEAAIRINLPVLWFSVGLAIFTGIIFGLSPALQFSRPEVSQVMQSSTRKVLGGVRSKRIHNLLIGGQIALTLLLLATAGAAIQGFIKLNRVHLGYNPHNVMAVGIPLHENSYTTWESRAQYFTQLKQKIAAMPEVKMAGLSTNATPPDNGWGNKFELLGRPSAEEQRTGVNWVSNEYFPVLQIPLLQGRIWDETESERGARVAVINETMARHFFPAGDALGRQVRMPNMKAPPQVVLSIPESNDWFEVVGVVGDALNDGLEKPAGPAIYIPYTVFMPPFTQILVRTEVPPLSILNDVRRQIQFVDADQQVQGNVRDLEERIKAEPDRAQQHLMAMLFGVFAGLALALAAVGLYSVVSYTVAQRTNEFGIRMALGAQRADVLRMVFRSTSVSVGGGILAGILLSLAMKRVIVQWAQGSSISLVVLLGVTALLVVVGVMACLLPARRASSIDPMQALRYE
jgi:putative ABC transport system permease protein